MVINDKNVGNFYDDSVNIMINSRCLEQAKEIK